MMSFGHLKPCQKAMYIYASLSLIISLIKLMRVNYAYNNKKNLTWIFMKGTGCYRVNLRAPFRVSAPIQRLNIEAIIDWVYPYVPFRVFFQILDRIALNPS